ncbi:glycosyltransferase family 2 protein [Roseibacterium sp. SDUM158017]|nr:glycosyltransferase family 2 protein [Roseibacterium sp. SDUM158017]
MVVSMMKDEAPYLLEWVAHHIAVGFTDILVYTNDCTDGTVEMLRRLQELGLAHHRDNTIPAGMKPQPSAIRHAQDDPLVARSDWLLLCDADEFLCINHPSGTLDGLLDAVVAEGANGIVLTWRIFGSSGIADWSRAPVTEQFVRAAPLDWNKGWGVKTLFRFDPAYWKLGIHRPSIRNKWLATGFPDSVKWLNGSGRPMEPYFRFRGWRSIRRTVGHDWAQMNHYALKSADAYALRKARGNVNAKKDKYDAAYWALQDRNEAEDRGILRHAPRRREVMTALLADPILADLHEAAQARVEVRLAAMRRTRGHAALRESLLAASRTPIEQVDARPPKARDPARIAARMARVERKAATPADTTEGGRHVPHPHNPAPPAPAPPGTAPGEIADWVRNQGIDLPADPRVLEPTALEAIRVGRFERRHARNIAAYLEPGARLLDIGTGLAFIPLRALAEVDGLLVLAQDDRPGLIPLARRVAERAGVADGPRLRLTADPLGPPNGGGAGAPGLAALIAAFRPTVLRLARPEAVPPPALAAQDLSPLARVVLPFASAAGARALRAAYAPVLHEAGFREATDRAGAGSLQFDRGT